MEATGARLIKYGEPGAQISIWHIADIHLLNRSANLHRLQADIDAIKSDPLSFWTLGGDYADWISPGDPRFDASVVDENISVSDLGRLAEVVINKLVDILKPIANKCLGACYGNHDWKYFTVYNCQNIHQQLCKSLDCANLGYCGFFDLYVERTRNRKKIIYYRQPTLSMIGPNARRLRVFVHHGFSGSATAGGKINALQKALDSVDADLVLFGHVHESLSKVSVQLKVSNECKEVEEKCQLGVITGTYLCGYHRGVANYGEMRGYRPTTLGAARVIWRPEQEELSALTSIKFKGR